MWKPVRGLNRLGGLLCGALALGANAQITVDTAVTNGLFEPHSVAADRDDLIYIADSANHRIVRYNPNTGVAATLAGIPGESGSNDGPPWLAHFNSPQGIVLATVGGVPGVIVADTGNHKIRFVNLTNGVVSTLAGTGATGFADNSVGTSATFRFPIGLDLDAAGILYVADSMNNAIRQIDLNNPSFPVTTLNPSGTTTFRQPNAVAVVSTNQLWVADTRNHTIKLLTRTGPTNAVLTTYMGSNDQNVYGTTDSLYGPSARFNQPRGLLWLGGAGLIIADTSNHTLRIATNNPAFGATNYGVGTLAGVPGQSGYVNGAASTAQFSSPHGLARDALANAFLVADTANSVIRRVQTGPPLPPVSAPAIGWVDFPPPEFVSLLRTNGPFVLNNEVIIAILSEPGTETFFTFGPTPPSPVEDTIPNPSRTTGASAPRYQDRVGRNDVPPSIIDPMPDVTIKAIGTQDGRMSSPVVQTRFQFKVANPNIFGNNAASFRVTNATVGASMWYTTDGSDPQPGGPTSVGPISAPATISLNATGDVTFKIRGFRENFKPSDVVTRVFAISNYIPNRITFGLTNGEPSSAFIARPGQIFYAPVTLQLQPGGETMYALEFNVAVTNAPGSAPLAPGAGMEFFSMLVSEVPKERANRNPPPDFRWFLSIPPFVIHPPSNWVATSTFINTNINLMGVAWLFRPAFEYFFTDINGTYLLDFDTTKHDLIKYSIAHDTLFDKDNGVVVVGAYAFQVPTNAAVGDQYWIQLGSPSASRDGVGAPGSEVYIRPPSSSTAVTVGTPSYLVGDVAPFRWLNAGDFGNGMLDKADEMQVFQSAILGLHIPPANSDLFRAMDSCGVLGSYDPSQGYYTNAGAMNPAQIQAMFDGSDYLIDQVAFGDGNLDVCDLFVTLRRSLDPSLKWFVRFWTNGQFVARETPNLAYNSNGPPSSPGPLPFDAQAAGTGGNPAEALVLLSAGDAIASPGQTVQIPVLATRFGNYPIRVLGLSLTVRPLDGAPGLTQDLQFTPSSALGTPTLSARKHAANVANAWLNSSAPGLASNAVLGTLTFTLPTNAAPNAAWAVYFEHASASPNGLASLPKRTRAGLITVTDRSASSWNDGIPDSWRLRWFGTTQNLLSAANADADGDGATNWEEYKAGTNPNDPESVLRLRTARGESRECVLRWPTASGKAYVIERSPSLVTPVWTALSTNWGTGGDIEFRDTAPLSSGFYRVRPLD